MSTAALISVEDYLRTTYEPDCDYVDGEVIERNVGERPHGKLQFEFAYLFRNQRHLWKTHALIETRMQVSKTRFRIPDICVYIGAEPQDRILRTPPFICVEILSPEDRIARMQDRIDDYIKFGVPYVWVINPENRRVWVYTAEGSREVKDGVLRTENPSLMVNLSEIFSGIDG
jgi:Uma2 family endonuclease